MHTLLKNLSTAWLLLALIVAPLQAMAAPFAAGGHDDCPMMKPGQHAAAGMHYMHHQMDHAGGGHGQTDCPQCSDDGCDGGQCKNSGCCSLHLQPCSNPVALQLEQPPVAEPDPGYRTHFNSLPPSPHYRPPV